MGPSIFWSTFKTDSNGHPMKEIPTRSPKNLYIPRTHPSQSPSLNHYFHMIKVSLSIIQCHFLDHLFGFFKVVLDQHLGVEQSPFSKSCSHMSKMTHSSRADQPIINHMSMIEHLFISSSSSYVLHFEGFKKLWEPYIKF